MANHNINVTSSSFYDREMGTTRSTQVSPSSLNVTQGDTITVKYTQGSGGQTYVDITGWDSYKWNSTSYARLYSGQTVVRTLNASSGSDVLTANFPSSSFLDRNFTINAISATDTTPDSFNLGYFVTGAERSTLYKAENDITVSGLSSGTPITASITNGVFTVNDSNSGNATSSNKTVYNGSKIRVWSTSSSAYNTSITSTLNLNGVTDTFRTTTLRAPESPSDGTLIPFGVTSGSISMGSLRDFFGKPTYNSNTIGMNNLYRGGDLVPNITQNNSVPTSGSISLSNLHNCYTSLFWDKRPASKGAFIMSQYSGGTANIAWNNNITANGEADFDVGYKLLKLGVEYRWTITNTNYLSRVIHGGTTSTPTGTFTTPWYTDGTLILQKDYGQGSLNDGNGLVTLEVRKIWNGTTYTLSSGQVYWAIVVESGQ